MPLNNPLDNQNKSIKILDEQEILAEKTKLRNEMDTDVLKQAMIEKIDALISARSGLLSYAVHNHGLTKEKKEYLTALKTSVNNFGGTPEELDMVLDSYLLENAKLSKQYGKRHYNLVDKNGKPPVEGNQEKQEDQEQQQNNDVYVKKGYSSRKSHFAELIYDLKDMVKRSGLQEIVKSSPKIK